jgi:oligopeptide transport system substrate-binding protein
MFTSGDGRNEAGYSNVQFDELIAAAVVDPDLRTRNERLARAEEVLLADLPIIPIYHYGGATLVSRKVDGVVENSTGFHLTRYISKE